MKRTTEQEAFLRADTLAEITRLSLDDLETQCVRGDLGANMRLWLTTEARPPSTGVYGGGERICTVCLAERPWSTESGSAPRTRTR